MSETVPPSHPPGASVRPGVVLGGRYRLDRPVASGGMAQVWAGVDTVLERPVAVKVLHPHLAHQESLLARFRTEAVAAARVGHAGIVAVYDTCSEQGLEAIVMELVTGPTLRERLDRSGPMAPGEVVDLGARVADALDAAHRTGLVHRDIKPGNLLLSDDGRVLLGDFGIAKLRDDTELTQTGTVLGTVKYLAPEQVEGRPVDARTDVYALGVVLFEALCGRPPWVADSQTATAIARLHSDPPWPSQLRAGIPHGLELVVLRALARRPDDRWPDARALRDALRACHDPARLTPLLGVTSAPAASTPAGPPAPPVSPPVAGHAAPGPARPPSAAPVAHGPPSPPSWGVAAGPAGAPAPVAAEGGRGWLLPASLLLVVAAVLALVAALVGRSDEGDAATGAVLAVGVSSFDPQGTGPAGEMDAALGALDDGDPTTAWRTERYADATFGGLKDGVGVVLELSSAHEVHELAVRSQSEGWSAEVYLSSSAEPPADLDGWGEPVALGEGVGGDHRFALGGVRATAVLLWITDLGDPKPLADDPDGEPKSYVALNEVELRA